MIGWVDSMGSVNGFDYHYDLSVKKHQEQQKALEQNVTQQKLYAIDEDQAIARQSI